MRRALLFLLAVLALGVPRIALADGWITVAESLEVKGATAVQTGPTFQGKDTMIRILASGAGGGLDTTNWGGRTDSILVGGYAAGNYSRAWFSANIADSLIPDVLDSAKFWASTATFGSNPNDTLYIADGAQVPTEGTGTGYPGAGGYSKVGSTWRSFGVVTLIGDSAWAKAGCDSPLTTVKPAGQIAFQQTVWQMVQQGLAVYNTSTQDRSAWYRLGAYTSHTQAITSWDFTEHFYTIYYLNPRYGGVNAGFWVRDGRESESGGITFKPRESDTAGAMWGFYIYGKKRIPRVRMQ